MEGSALAGGGRWFQPDVVITSEPNDTRLCIGQRGRAKVVGRRSPVGRAMPATPREGLNAAEALAGADRRGRARRASDAPDRSGVRDLTCIDVASWPYPSVSTVPGRAQARFDCRFLPGETAESLVTLLDECARAGVGRLGRAAGAGGRAGRGGVRRPGPAPSSTCRSSPPPGGPTRTAPRAARAGRHGRRRARPDADALLASAPTAR